MSSNILKNYPVQKKYLKNFKKLELNQLMQHQR